MEKDDIGMPPRVLDKLRSQVNSRPPSGDPWDRFLGHYERKQDSVSVRKMYLRIVGDLAAAFMLSYIVDYFRADVAGEVPCGTDEWLVRRLSDWQEECCLSPDQARRCIRLLIGKRFITCRTKKHMGTPMTHIRLNRDVLMRAGEAAKRTGVRTREGYVYLMRCHFPGHYKIGWSTDPGVREHTLQAEDPSVRLLGWWEGTKQDERKIHQEYASQRVRGEWFALSAAQLNALGRRYMESGVGDDTSWLTDSQGDGVPA